MIVFQKSGLVKNSERIKQTKRRLHRTRTKSGLFAHLSLHLILWLIALTPKVTPMYVGSAGTCGNSARQSSR